jgi:aminoglycoside 2''-phosphotransferase
VDIGKLVNVLEKDFRNIKEKELKFTYHGTFNVFEIRKKILRVPDKDLRNHKGSQIIQNETVKLKNLAKLLSISIPKPENMSLNDDMPYVMYQKLPGVSLSTVFDTLNEQKKKRIAEGIAEFLNQLHAPHVLHTVHSSIFHTKFAASDYKEFWENRFEEIKEKIFPLVNTSQKAWIYTIFSRFLRNSDNFLFKPAITHCDFDTSNILVNPQKGIVTGIIDFEETKAWDPAADLLFFEDPTFQRQILESYNYVNSPSLQNRMKFLYCQTFAPYITWGLDHGKREMVEFGLKKLEKIQKKFSS